MSKAQLCHEIRVAQRLLSQLGGSRALTISIMLRNGLYTDILALSVDPLDYLDASDFFLAYQATRLLQKSKWLPTGIDKKKVAKDTFWVSESKCKDTNDLFRALSSGTVLARTPGVMSQLLAAKRKIRKLLPRRKLFDFLDYGGFGPGSDSDTVGGFTAAYDKLSRNGSVTRGCSVYLDFLAQHSMLGRIFQWDISTRQVICQRVSGNRVTFVPKDAKTDRSIAVEPRWNIFFQKGAGRVLREILKHDGTDLNDQTRNQRFALQGSLDGSLATLDLKSASDTVSLELVRFLLPEEWVSVLERLRSPTFTLDGVTYESEKWSSMGNGYTFELESLIFHALLSSVTDSFSVYGDDLIVPTDRVQEAVDLLTFCGFSLNEKKSFVTGPFRESCGADYFNGVLVTPIYWKDPLNVEGTLRLVNQISRLASHIGGGHVRDRRFYAIWRDLVYRLPEHFRYRCPTSISSGVHDSSGTWTKRAKWEWDGWFIKVILPKPLKFKYRLYEPAMLSQFFQPSSDGYSIRDRIKYRVGTVFIPSGFEDLGVWG